MEVLRVADADVADVRARMGEVLRSGELVVAPTDTVYGVWADATSVEAVERLFELRGVPWDRPPPVLLHNPHFVTTYVTEVSEAAERLMAAYWPGPLTLLFTPRADLGWALGPDRLAVSIRMPADPLALQVLHDVGPLACTSASRAGEPPPTTLGEAQARLGDDVALYVDDGPRDGSISTVVDLTRGGAEVLREGAVPTEHVAVVAGGALELGQRPTESEQEEEGPAAN